MDYGNNFNEIKDNQTNFDYNNKYQYFEQAPKRYIQISRNQSLVSKETEIVIQNLGDQIKTSMQNPTKAQTEAYKNWKEIQNQLSTDAKKLTKQITKFGEEVKEITAKMGKWHSQIKQLENPRERTIFDKFLKRNQTKTQLEIEQIIKNQKKNIEDSSFKIEIKQNDYEKKIESIKEKSLALRDATDLQLLFLRDVHIAYLEVKDLKEKLKQEISSSKKDASVEMQGKLKLLEDSLATLKTMEKTWSKPEITEQIANSENYRKLHTLAKPSHRLMGTPPSPIFALDEAKKIVNQTRIESQNTYDQGILIGDLHKGILAADEKRKKFEREINRFSLGSSFVVDFNPWDVNRKNLFMLIETIAKTAAGTTIDENKKKFEQLTKEGEAISARIVTKLQQIGIPKETTKERMINIGQNLLKRSSDPNRETLFSRENKEITLFRENVDKLTSYSNYRAQINEGIRIKKQISSFLMTNPHQASNLSEIQKKLEFELGKNFERCRQDTEKAIRSYVIEKRETKNYEHLESENFNRLKELSSFLGNYEASLSESNKKFLKEIQQILRSRDHTAAATAWVEIHPTTAQLAKENYTNYTTAFGKGDRLVIKQNVDKIINHFNRCIVDDPDSKNVLSFLQSSTEALARMQNQVNGSQRKSLKNIENELFKLKKDIKNVRIEGFSNSYLQIALDSQKRLISLIDQLEERIK